MKKITIVDYGIGNIKSISNMLDFLGIDVVVTSNPKKIINASSLILPGVGSFDYAMMSLNKKHLIDPLNEAVMSKQIPILGICLGMQIMSSRSEEGRLEGLSWIPSSVIRINSEARKDDLPSKSIITKPQSLIVPHIGWSKVKIKRNNLLFNNMRLFEDPRYYFVHSYYVKCKFTKHVIATIDYGNEMCCAFNSDNIFGVQFHPEKSHKYGMNLLRQFYNA